MEYRLLGNSGLKVSVIGLGNGLNSENPENQQRSIEQVKRAYELGINFFDTAEFYGFGEAEKQLGVALKTLNIPREDIVVSTKIFWGTQIGDQKRVNHNGLNRKHIKEGVRNSLKRLQLDYADVVYCHRFDHETPLEEVARAYTELIQEGLIHYWGTSEWSAANIFELREVCAEKNLIKPIVEQPEYNMLVRDRFESEYARLFDIHKMGSTVWSPLASGVLTGKYNDGNVPKDSRFDTHSSNGIVQGIWGKYFSNKDLRVKQLQELGGVAKEMGISQSQLALSWVIANKDVSSAITGCSRIEQLEESVKCVEIYKKISPEINKRINEILQNNPKQDNNYKTFTPLPSRR